MEDEFQRVIIHSMMGKPSFLSGHTHEIQRPCQVYGLYRAKTGTLLLEQAWCDGTTYPASSFNAEEREKFYNEMIEYLADCI